MRHCGRYYAGKISRGASGGSFLRWVADRGRRAVTGCRCEPGSACFADFELDQIGCDDVVGLAAAPVNEGGEIGRDATVNGARGVEHESALARGDPPLRVVIVSFH